MKIQVNYQELYQSGNYLHSQADQYEQLIERINQLMLSTSSVWQGSDNDAFIEQVEILRPQLMRMVYVIESYADVWKTCSQAYEQLQQNRLAQARNL
ncbi:WXG100 family type VII secretion target [Firmicutes bacterium M10-2]|nr:WXG100 family type VII secretion target [Firmicutes bacterium M10-2]